eukprot:g6984.t1
MLFLIAEHNIKKGQSDLPGCPTLLSIKVTNDIRQILTFYDIEESIGYGRFGETKIVVHKQTRQKFACKTVRKSHLTHIAVLNALKREIDFLKLFKGCDSIASFHDVYEDCKAVHIILELCTGGELFHRIREKKAFSEHEAAMMLRSILLTVILCHDHYIVHSDLKPENFIFSHIGPGASLKAIDFGISRLCQEGCFLTEFVGTLQYMAPEIFDQKYSFPADIWSCGVILYILVYGEVPFYGETPEDTQNVIRYWNIDCLFQMRPAVSNSLKQCISKMLDKNPETRATAREILHCDWMKEQHAAPLEPIPNAIYAKLKSFSKYNLLKKVSLKLIASSLPKSEKVAISVLFHQLASPDSKTISASQMYDALVSRGGPEIRRIDIVQLFYNIDESGSGEISYQDFVAANMRLGQLASDDHISYVFSLLDQDSNGYVTTEELHAFLSSYCASYVSNSGQISSIIDSTDINNDGLIDFKEYLALMRGSV